MGGQRSLLYMGLAGDQLPGWPTHILDFANDCIDVVGMSNDSICGGYVVLLAEERNG